MNWGLIRHRIHMSTPRWINKLRWSIGLWLLHREHKDVKTALWDIMMCQMDDYKLSPPTIELNVETGHGQIIRINNGIRTIHICLSARQIIINTWAKYLSDGMEEPKNVTGKDSTYSVMLPYSPNEIRSMVEAKELG